MTRLIYGFFPLSQDSCRRQKTEHCHIMWRKSRALKHPIILITVVILSPSSWQRNGEMHMMQLSSWRRSIWLLEKEIELLTAWSIVKKSTIINGFGKAGLLRSNSEAIQLRHRRRWLQWFQCTGGGRWWPMTYLVGYCLIFVTSRVSFKGCVKFICFNVPVGTCGLFMYKIHIF